VRQIKDLQIGQSFESGHNLDAVVRQVDFHEGPCHFGRQAESRAAIVRRVQGQAARSAHQTTFQLGKHGFHLVICKSVA